MESIGAVIFKECAVPELNKTNQVKNDNEEFAEMLAISSGLPVISAEIFPGLLPEKGIDSLETLLGTNEVMYKGKNMVIDVIAKQSLVNPGLANAVKVSANQVGETSSFNLVAMMNSVNSEPKDILQQKMKETVIPKNIFNLVGMRFKSLKEGSPEHNLQVGNVEEGLDNLIMDKKGVFFQQANEKGFHDTNNVKGEVDNYDNLLQLNVGDERTFKVKLVKDTQETKNFAEVNNNGEIKQNKEVNKIKDHLVEQKNTSVMQQVNFLHNGEELNAPVMEPRVKVTHLAKELPEIVISKLKAFENKDGSQDVLIHLEPKELGKLVVKLTSVENTVSVKITAHYPLTRDLLENGLNSLRQSLLEQGISFDRLDVELGGQQLNQSQYQHREQQTWLREKGYSALSTAPETNSYAESELSEPKRDDRLLDTGTYDYIV